MKSNLWREALLEVRLHGVAFKSALSRLLAKENAEGLLEGEMEELERIFGPLLDVTSTEITTLALQSIPSDLAHKRGVLPLEIHDDVLKLAMRDPTDHEVIAEVERISGLLIHPLWANAPPLRQEIARHYKVSNATSASSNHKVVSDKRNDKVSNSPAAQLVEEVLREAQRHKCSDVHLEPSEHGLVTRLRQDGTLRIYKIIPAQIKEEVVARVKIMANLDIAEKRRPQDGRIRWIGPGGKLDLRISVLPTAHGEKVVIRILDQDGVNLDLESLGMWEDQKEIFVRQTQRPHGMILVTGPTGSGKTTSLYAALKGIRSPELNISTIEDPIEYRMEGINQTQVNAKIGLTFASALRSLLRQDPNVLLVGEIRDKETAELAIQAALTGHLMLSTLHTNDAPSAIPRLIDIGIEPFLITSSLSLVVSQRLVRKACPQCQETVQISPEHALALDLDPLLLMPVSQGCSHCGFTGYLGRLAIYEMFETGEWLSAVVKDKVDGISLRQIAIEKGMLGMREDGIRKAMIGLTTLAEVLAEAG